MSNRRLTMRALLIAIFVSSIPSTLILPMLPSLGQQFGVGPTELGLLVGVYPLTSMIASPFWGRMSDRFGRRPILIATLAGGALAYLCFALSTSWIGLLAGRAMQGLAGTPRGIGFAVASDLSDDEGRAGGMGRVTASMAVAFMLGPLIGGLFMSENPDSLIGQVKVLAGLPAGGFNHVLPSVVGLLLNLLGMIIIVTGFGETWRPQDKAPEGQSEANTHSFAEAMLHVGVLVAVFFFMLAGFIQGSLQFSFALWADIYYGWIAQWIAWAGASIGLGFAIGSGLVLRPLLRRVGEEWTVLAGTLIDGSGLAVLLAFQSTPPVALAGLTLSSLGGALWATTILGLLSRGIDRRDQGVALGAANGASLLGRVMGPACAGYLAVDVSPTAPFIAMLACVCLASVRGVFLVRSRRKLLIVR